MTNGKGSGKNSKSGGREYKNVFKALRQGRILSLTETEDGGLLLSTWDSAKQASVAIRLSLGEMIEMSEKLRVYADKVIKREVKDGVSN